MLNYLKRAGSEEARTIRKYFAEEIDRIQVPPPPPSVSNGWRKQKVLSTLLLRVAAAAVTAAGIVIFALTARNPTSLSQEIGNTISSYNIQIGITTFVEKARAVYRSGLNGG